MKKVVSFVLVFIMLISSIAVYADDEKPEEANTDNSKYEVNLKSSSANLKQGDKVTLSIMLENINIDEGKGGVAGVKGTLSYDDNVLDIDKFEGSNWELMANGKTFLANSKDGNTTTDALEIGRVTLKVKDDAKNGTTAVKITDITGSVGELALVDMDGQSKDLTLNISDTVNEEQKNEDNKNEEPKNEEPKNEEQKSEESKNEESKNNNQLTLVGIVISSMPNKTSYLVGDKFDKAGMVVIAKYSDGTSKEITNYTISPSENLTENDKQVKITYSEGNEKIEQTIEIKVNKANDPNENNSGVKKDDKENETSIEVNKTNSTQDSTTSSIKLPQTGTIGFAIPFVIIIILIGGAIIFFRKYKKMI